jgi:hypothetical protein
MDSLERAELNFYFLPHLAKLLTLTMKSYIATSFSQLI